MLIMLNQIYSLLAFFIAGICIGILFDIFRITRKTFKTPNIITYIEDILFWLITGAILLFTIFTFTTGEIRLYMVIFLVFGSFIYFISISKYFIIINTKILCFFKSIIIFLLKPLLLLKNVVYCRFKKIFSKILKKNQKSSVK